MKKKTKQKIDQIIKDLTAYEEYDFNDVNYRLYSITNMYTSGIHAGIQTAHALHEMYSDYSSHDNMLSDWADNHKTIIVLNGGYQSNLEKIHKLFGKLDENYGLPISKFHEEKDALNGALTAVAIILPDCFYSLLKLKPKLIEKSGIKKTHAIVYKFYQALHGLKLAT